MRSCLLLLLSAFLPCCLVGQELPPVISFQTETYQAGSQNWGVSQDDQGFIYVANNEGLLVYDGNRWVLYPSPNQSILRSVKAHQGRIYTGSYMDFGYWEPSATGTLAYHSLGQQVLPDILPDEQFWKIIEHEGYLVFQSFNQLFLYDVVQDELEVIRLDKRIAKVFSTTSGLYFIDHDNQLFQYRSGKVVGVSGLAGAALPVAHLWEEGGELLVQSTNQGSFVLEEGQFFPRFSHDFLKDQRIYSATSLRKGGMAFGTISDGVYILDASGQLKYHLDQVDGLTNNTILSLFEDAQSNLWAGTDNGISCINLASPFRVFTDNTGQLGTVYTSVVHQGDLYLGSNQGLFVKSLRGNDLPELIPGTRGQVWSLFSYQGDLFCGHDLGSFQVENRRIKDWFSETGTWIFQPIPGQPSLLLAGSYSGLEVLARDGANWVFRNKVEGFDYSARFVAVKEDGEVYVSHEYRGVYAIRLEAGYRRVKEQRRYEEPRKGKNAGLAGFQDSIYYFSREGLFSLRDYTRGFRPSPDLTDKVEQGAYVSGKMTSTKDRLWFFTKNEMGYFRSAALSDGLLRETIPVPIDLINAKSGYENITQITEDSLLIGTGNGYVVLVLSEVGLPQHELYLTSAKASPAAGATVSLELTAGGKIPYRAHNLSFSVAVPAYEKFFIQRFRSRLIGYREDWSDWTETATILYPELPPGAYTLEVQSMLGRTVSAETLRFPFVIQRPWYSSYPALLLYFLMTGLFVTVLHRAYTRYYRNKARLQQEENERLIAAQQQEVILAKSQLTNQQLQQDIKGKNREMAISTMNLVKKNELLQRIKDNLLVRQDPQQNIKEVIRMIDRNIDEAETWKLFKEAFENADRDFFKKVKDLHPELTPNDLKLCAYLRLNLSSKEIAPMLNISPKSVEVKRYRLRKKMGLDHEVGLVAYILDL